MADRRFGPSEQNNIDTPFGKKNVNKSDSKVQLPYTIPVHAHRKH